ncbi:hypothetical protein DI09_43p150 [Mitosporidium daphniae]|uniref:RRM domain-containing protein n=1 Tax=Mitosporidium daphniae TaxID=1485682 RepID=A0A098VQ71_9MICR|nr:uncharacterized protein DI09_43p150 [Mitosporidium daphniae]KGG51140.1 hypothetical protein DI09_43p150 [Mitosporidium daphniae]|eukprot:XP_013237567.1 uncharacterized protein DI09_43p150 [Mitosporidium daphniae]
MLVHNEIKITNISQAVQGDLIYHLFSIIGPIRSFVIHQSECTATISQALVTWEVMLAYSSEDEVWAATRLSGIELADRKLLVVPISYEEEDHHSIIDRVIKSSRTLYIANLPSEATELDLSQLFLKESLGKIIFARVFSGWPMSKYAAEALGIPKYASIELESAKTARNVLSFFNSSEDAPTDAPVCWLSKDTHFNDVDNQDDDKPSPPKVQPHIVKIARRAISATNPLYAGLPEEALKRKMLQLAVSKSSVLLDSHKESFPCKTNASPTSTSARISERQEQPSSGALGFSKRHAHGRTGSPRTRRSRSPEPHHHHHHHHHHHPAKNSSDDSQSSYYYESKADKLTNGHRQHEAGNKYSHDLRKDPRDDGSDSHENTRKIGRFCDNNSKHERDGSGQSASSVKRDSERSYSRSSSTTGDESRYRLMSRRNSERVPASIKNVLRSTGSHDFRPTLEAKGRRPLRSLSPPLVAKRDE